MGITAKELAKKMNLSATAVSMALNNKPGVSTQTRQLVVKTAEEYGFDFSKLKSQNQRAGTVYVIFYKTNNAILSYTPIFDELFEGIKNECQKEGLTTRLLQFYEKTDILEDFFSDIRGSGCIGFILVGTEIKKEICQQFIDLKIPMILLDTYFESLACTSILINNTQGMYMSTDYLYSLTQSQPGYLMSTYTIPNFVYRQEGYYKAIRENGMSVTRSIIHKLSPSIENAMADMLSIIDQGDALAKCYVADNDIIAIGAMKAFKLRGYKIPEDISMIGFDNISESRIVEPALTTMDVPRYFIGKICARQLIFDIDNKNTFHHEKIEIAAKLIKRLSTCN